jgi:hypothetical protein
MRTVWHALWTRTSTLDGSSPRNKRREALAKHHLAMAREIVIRARGRRGPGGRRVRLATAGPTRSGTRGAIAAAAAVAAGGHGGVVSSGAAARTTHAAASSIERKFPLKIRTGPGVVHLCRDNCARLLPKPAAGRDRPRSGCRRKSPRPGRFPHPL